MTGITAFGAYVPRMRLSRKAIAEAQRWLNPNAVAAAKGERSLGNWDEDAVTMAVEAARDCLTGLDRAAVDAVYLASTSLPFLDRLNAGIVAAALNLREDLPAADIASTQRAGTTALMQALGQAAAGGVKAALVTAGDRRKARAMSAGEMQWGDGAAALLVGAENPVARYLGGATVTVDFVDHFRGEGQDFDYGWEERWIRDEGYSKIMPRAIKAALAKADVGADAIDHFVMPCVFPGLAAQIAKGAGIKAEAVADNLAAVMGEAGAAHALIMLCATLEKAAPGQKILVAGFGQGADALIFETTGALAALPARRGVAGSLKQRKEETNYMKFLVFNGLIDWEKGMRAEQDKKTALTTLYRRRDMILGLTGGKCGKCGTVQFPRARICVNPNCNAVDSQEPYHFSEIPGKILSWSADYLAFSMNPPNHYGMIDFAEGGRFMADFTDCDPGTVESGQTVHMVFRIKDDDERRGFRKYFWKAVPQN